MLSTVLMYSGPVGYVLVWILYFIITTFFELSEKAKNIFFIYAVVPWGGVCTTGCGYIVWALGG